ncbi:MAG: NAD(+)/NADH kinase [Candidatus Heimdallarchaeota archaeon]
MNDIKKVAVISRLSQDKHKKLANEVVSIFENYDVDVYLNETFAKVMNHSSSISMEKINTADLVVALGGDGTILWTARYSDEVPIFGINAGYLGFLTTATLDNSEISLQRIMTGDFVLERCMRLKLLLDGNELPTALNEVYVTNEKNAQICNLNLEVDGFNLGHHRLDGLLVSTPVGSTAYALSAGGSIIEPKIKAMQIVPVNSVTRRIRPFVVPGDSKVTISIPSYSTKKVAIVIDGNEENKFPNDSKLEVTQAKRETVFLRFPDHGFFNRLQDKLGF